jgi:hypothetical protein
MNIPLEWYIYVIPGIIILASLFPLLNTECLKILFERFNNDRISYTVILVFLAYVIGFVSNAVAIEFLKPILNKFGWLSVPIGVKFADPIFIHVGYQSQILYRLMFGAFVLFSFTSIFGIILKVKINNWKPKIIQFIFVIIIIIVTIALYRKWQSHREWYWNFSSKAVSVIKQSNIN